MKQIIFLFSLSITLLFHLSCADVADEKLEQMPNIILIMADDMGYECLGAYGSTDYKTPNLDKMAEEGVLFENCISQPLCTPSRVKIMTGLYNYRNYEYFGYLNDDQHTFGNLMKDAGYATCIVGKWQLNGISYKNEIEDWDDNKRPYKLGFDEYCLWQLTKARAEGERYANPLIDQNGTIIAKDENNYGPDVFVDYLLNFIERKQDSSFFIYYPMVLVHDPFVPTPISENWKVNSERYNNDTSYFKDMVYYTDQIIGKINKKLKDLNLDQNTLIFFTADNGTHNSIMSNTVNGVIQGGKANTTDAGTRVPLIAYWPKRIENSIVHKGLVDFSDFYPTLAELVGKDVNVDGRSFFKLLIGEEYHPKQTIFLHYDPRWGKFANQFRNQFARTLQHKLYRDGSFFDLLNDNNEIAPLNKDSLTMQELEIYGLLKKELEKHPILN
ncbi:MAG: sulfatase-like hydrolase/transferase [Melioribacteraceae bacterium]|nr:sulfatase-like hydrolase/transferase [Melioribacteraceae bacterium]